MEILIVVTFLILNFLSTMRSSNAIRIGKIPTYFRPIFEGVRRKGKPIKY